MAATGVFMDLAFMESGRPQGCGPSCSLALNAPASASGGCSAADLRATVFASRRGGVEVVGQACRAGLGRRGITEHGLALSGHDRLVGQDDHEINDGHEDDEVDDRGYEAPEV